MNCASCKKPLPANAAKCPACGAAAKKEEYSYDLLPDEPASKKDEGGPGQQYQLPPGAILPPPSAMAKPKEEAPEKAPLRTDRARGANSQSGKPNFFKLGVAAGAILIVGLLGMRMCGGTKVKITGNGARQDGASFSVSNLMTRTYNVEILGGKASYEATVEAKNGDILFGLVTRGPKDKVDPATVKSWNLAPVKKGESKTISGELDSGNYSIVIATDSKVMISGTLKSRVK